MAELSAFAASFLFGLLFIFLGILLLFGWRFVTTLVNAIEHNPGVLKKVEEKEEVKEEEEKEEEVKEEEEEKNDTEKAMPQLLEFVAYIIFFGTFCATMVASRDPGAFHTTSSYLDMFAKTEFAYNKNFENMGRREQVIDWLRDVVVPMAYPETSSYASGEALEGVALSYMNDGVSLRVGPVRLRQIRVEGQRNSLTRYLGNDLKSVPLYPAYSANCDLSDTGVQDLRDYVTDDLTVKYKNDSPGTPYFSTMTRQTYCGGGHVVELSSGNVTAQLDSLLTSDFLLGPPVRAIALEFVTYNANADLFTLLRAFVELLPSGAVVPTMQVSCVPLTTMARIWHQWDDSSAGEKAFFLNELIMYAQIYALFCKNIWQLFKMRLTFFFNLWRVSSFALSLCTAIVSFFRLTNARWAVQRFDEIIDKTDFPTEVAARIVAYQRIDEVAAVATIMMSVRLFKYLSAYRPLAQFWNTVCYAAYEILPICLILTIILVGYASAFYTAFGSELANYRDFATSLRSMWRGLLGDINPSEILGPTRQTTHGGFTGFFLFVSFVFLTIFVVLSMFLSIVDQAYDQVSEDLDKMDHNVNEAFTRELWRFATSPARSTERGLNSLLEMTAGVKLDFDKIRNKVPRIDAAFSSVIDFQRLQNLGVLSELPHDSPEAEEEEEEEVVDTAETRAKDVFEAAVKLLEAKPRLFNGEKEQQRPKLGSLAS